MEDITFKKLSSEIKYKGNKLDMYEEEFLLPDGNTVKYDSVINKDGAGVLLIDNDGKLILTRQYRPAAGAVSLEIAAGSLEKTDSSFEDCARREAAEETGLIPNRLEEVTGVYTNVSFLKEMTKLYIGTELSEYRLEKDASEFISVIRITLDEAMKLISESKIYDSKTIILILAYKNILNEKNI